MRNKVIELPNGYVSAFREIKNDKQKTVGYCVIAFTHDINKAKHLEIKTAKAIHKYLSFMPFARHCAIVEHVQNFEFIN